MPRIIAELPPTTSPQLQRQAVPRINAEPATPADSPHTPQRTNLQPITPSKRRQQHAESDNDYKPETRSPTKRAKTARGASGVPPTPSRGHRTPTSAARTPSQKDLRAAKRKQEKEWKSDWNAEVARSIWKPVKDFRHPKSDRPDQISAKEAMEKYPVKRGELDTLPCQSRPNPYNRSCPVRSYKIEAVRQMACLKHAMLAGLHKNGLSKTELVSRGEELWKAAQFKRDQRRHERIEQIYDYVVYAYESSAPSDLENEAVEDDDIEPRTWDTNDCLICQYSGFA